MTCPVGDASWPPAGRYFRVGRARRSRRRGPEPPAIRTRPSRSRVAVCWLRGTDIEPVRPNWPCPMVAAIVAVATGEAVAVTTWGPGLMERLGAEEELTVGVVPADSTPLAPPAQPVIAAANSTPARPGPTRRVFLPRSPAPLGLAALIVPSPLVVAPPVQRRAADRTRSVRLLVCPAVADDVCHHEYGRRCNRSRGRTRGDVC
jgi:hypothetical protein